MMKTLTALALVGFTATSAHAATFHLEDRTPGHGITVNGEWLTAGGVLEIDDMTHDAEFAGFMQAVPNGVDSIPLHALFSDGMTWFNPNGTQGWAWKSSMWSFAGGPFVPGKADKTGYHGAFFPISTATGPVNTLITWTPTGDTQLKAVPEPGTLALLVLGALGFALQRAVTTR